MGKEITIALPKPHAAQLQILNEAKRFNVLANGRRFGKTKLSVRLVKPAITHAWKIGFWNATYKDLNEVWIELKQRLHGIIKSKDESLKKIYLLGGGQIDMWSMDDPDSGRGFKYNRAIVDEYCKARHAEYAWQNTIRPTLTDYSGDAWILSTPKGKNHPFYTLFTNRDRFDNWNSWQMPSSSNPHLPQGEIEEAESQYDPMTFRQEFLAEFISMAERPFMYCFEERHISDKAVYDPTATVYLSFDFNVNPMTAVAAQQGFKNNKPFIHFIDEVYLQNSDIFQVCEQIRSKFPSAHFMVTSDRSGLNRTGMNRNYNYYKLIQQELRIQGVQFKIPPNPFYEQNIVLCNSILARHPEVLFHPVKCKETIYDMRFVEWDGQKVIKDDRTKRAQRADLFDCVRYYFNTFQQDFLRHSKK